VEIFCQKKRKHGGCRIAHPFPIERRDLVAFDWIAYSQLMQIMPSTSSHGCGSETIITTELVNPSVFVGLENIITN
jgi:hypothetical protein